MLDAFVAIGRVLSDPTRTRILKMLEPGELCVCQITSILDLAPATVSKHLSLLRMAGLLAQRKEGRWVYYRLAKDGESANPYSAPIQEVLRGSLNEDPRIAEDRRRLARVNAMSLQELCAQGRGALSDDKPQRQRDEALV